jgi:hypothetical protein
MFFVMTRIHLYSVSLAGYNNRMRSELIEAIRAVNAGDETSLKRVSHHDIIVVRYYRTDM